MILFININDALARYRGGPSPKPFFDAMPLMLKIGSPSILIGSMIFYMMRENGRNYCLVSCLFIIAGTFMSLYSSFENVIIDYRILGIIFTVGGVIASYYSIRYIKQNNYL
jgi:hypothetical protein